MVGTHYTGEVKNSIGNGEAKELVCMTHGHELSGGILERRSYSAEGDKGKKKKSDNCSIIINKIYVRKGKKMSSGPEQTFLQGGHTQCP